MDKFKAGDKVIWKASGQTYIVRSACHYNPGYHYIDHIGGTAFAYACEDELSHLNESEENTPKEDRKKDSHKPPLALIPESALNAEAFAFKTGKEKSGYSLHSHRESVESYIRLASAALRHIYAWIEHRSYDDQTGEHHLGHARANLAMLIDWEERGIGIDDRFKAPEGEDDVDG